MARGKKKLTRHTLFQLHRPLIGPAGRQHRPGPCKCGERYQSAAAGAGAGAGAVTTTRCLLWPGSFVFGVCACVVSARVIAY